MKRSFRITRSTDFQRVRRSGKSYAHPLLVFVTVENLLDHSRVGLIVGKRVGGAVQRNRIKRRLRAILHQLLPALTPGRDYLFIAREPLARASFEETQQAVLRVIQRANLYHLNGNARALSDGIPE